MKAVVKNRTIRILRILILIEVIYGVPGIILWVRPMKSYSCTAMEDYDFAGGTGVFIEDFACAEDPGIYIDNSLSLSEDGTIEADMKKATLPPGSYTVTIRYSADTRDNRYDIGYGKSQWTALAAYEDVILPSGEDVSENARILSLTPMAGLYPKIRYGGNGYLFLEEVSIQETALFKRLYWLYGIEILSIIHILILLMAGHPEQRKTIPALIGIFLLSSMPVLGPHPGYGHDPAYHLVRIDALAEGLCDGAFPVRVSPYWNNGYGYASSLFYSDFFLLFPALLRLVGVSAKDAYRQYVILINALAAFVSYYSFKDIFKSRRTGIIGAVLYTLLPYRVTSLYLRAAVGEYTAMTFLPLIACGLYRIYKAPRKRGRHRIRGEFLTVLPAVIGFSGIIESHVITCVVVGVFLALILLVLWKRTFTGTVLLRLLFTALVTAALNAWFIVPFLDSVKSGIRVNSSPLESIANDGVHLLELMDLFPAGNGASVETAHESYSDVTEMNFSAGVCLYGTLLFFYLQLTGKLSKGRYDGLGKLTAALGIIGLWMTGDFFFWDGLCQISYSFARVIVNLQYPWRFLGISCLFLILCCLCMITDLRSDRQMDEREVCLHGKRREETFASLPVSRILVMVSLMSSCYLMHDYVTKTNWSDFEGEDAAASTWLAGAEYLPNDTDVDIFASSDPVLGEGVTLEDSGKEKGTYCITLQNVCGEESFIDVPFLYYPGYSAKDTDTGEKFAAVRGTGARVRIEVPAGYQGTFAVRYTERKLWRMAEAVSVLTFLWMVVMGTVSQKQGSRIGGEQIPCTSKEPEKT